MKNKIIRTALALLFVSVIVVTAPRAQQPAPVVAAQSPEDRVALYQALLDLTNPWTVMCIAAHPDDEDGTSLIVMRRKYGAHTVSLFSTFGEGGQNAIGPELYEELGAIRARETMAAAEIQGSEPHFLGLKDFGYSKSADEAFTFWGHDEALRRMVLQIRKLRPDVIITNHSVTNKDHGHHQATARLELEAFDAAADPTRFPEQLKDGVTVWQVQRLFVRARGNAQAQADNSPIVTIDPNEQDPVRGVVYAEEALRALQKHATQGPWPKTFAEYATRFRAFSGQQGGAPGQLPLTRYLLVREAKGAESLPKDSHNFLDGLVLKEESLRRLTSLMLNDPALKSSENAFTLLTDKDVFAKLSTLAKAFHQLHTPKITIPPSVNIREDLMNERLNVALAAAAGIKVDVAPEAKALVPGNSIKFTITIANNGNKEAHLYSIGLHGMGIGSVRPPDTSLIEPAQSIKVVRVFDAPQSASITVPHTEHLYDGRVFGERFTTVVPLIVQGSAFQIIERSAIDVAPPVEIKSTQPSLLVLTPQTESRPPSLQVTVVSHLNQPANVWVGAFGIAAGRPPISLVESVPPPLASDQSVELPMNARLRIQNFSNIEISAAIEKGKTRSVVAKATLPIIKADARVAPTLRVGYIRGFDYSLPNALAALGVESRELSVDEVKTADLQKFTSIIVDNRVYESEPELIAANQKLLDYANAGGTLIVFYHKSNEWNPDPRRNRPALAPYKLILGDERITDETAPITFIEPQHPLLNFPNKLGQEDFANWIQERGLYYPKDWDPQYHALLQSNDPGEAPLKGGLLVADYGRGHYIYTSMVWYRELRGGVPGAYRMLANMISYGHSK